MSRYIFELFNPWLLSTRDLSLSWITNNSGKIYRAISSMPWVGSASLEVAIVYVSKDNWNNKCFLDEKLVDAISSSLSPLTMRGEPLRLARNIGLAFQGSNLLGKGFILTEEEAINIAESFPKEKDVVFPLINGDDLNTHPEQHPSRWVINFRDWKLEKAEEYPHCLQIIRERVKPEREAIAPTNSMAIQRRELWWKFTSPTVELYETIKDLDYVLALSQVSAHHAVARIKPSCVFSHRVIVIASDSLSMFSIMQSTLHEIWARRPGSTTHETRGTYFTRFAFDPFPLPNLLECSDTELKGSFYLQHRSYLMSERQEGLTKTYNRFHDPNETTEDIQKLRELHIEMDYAVAAAYGWHDLLPSPLMGEGLGVRVTSAENPPHPPGPLLPWWEKGEQEAVSPLALLPSGETG